MHNLVFVCNCVVHKFIVALLLNITAELFVNALFYFTLFYFRIFLFNRSPILICLVYFPALNTSSSQQKQITNRHSGIRNLIALFRLYHFIIKNETKLIKLPWDSISAIEIGTVRYCKHTVNSTLESSLGATMLPKTRAQSRKRIQIAK